LAGYTSKTPGTEDGVLEPIPTFSTCYSAPFIVLHPGRYAEMLAERMAKHNVDCWLINTGWTGGKFGSGKRCPLKYTRRIVDAVHSGELAKAEYENFGTFNLSIPTGLEGVPRELLNPSLAWKDREAFNKEVRKLAGMFQKAFALYERDVEPKVRDAGPQI
jgi:phosphoenolpyruvate carboxykinase (ATP)